MTPGIARRPFSSCAEERGLGSRSPSSHACSAMNAAAPPMPAIVSNAPVPVSHVPGRDSRPGRTRYGSTPCSRSGCSTSTPACGPYHLYGEVTSESMPQPLTSIGRCGARATASTCSRAPAAWVIARRGAQIGSETREVRRARQRDPRDRAARLNACSRSARSSEPSAGATGTTVTSAPASRAASTHGVMLESWSSCVQTMRSPPFHVRASARVYANINAVELAPKITCEPAAPSRRPTAIAHVATIAPVRTLASNAPPTLAGSGLREVRVHRVDRGVDRQRPGRTVEPHPTVGEAGKTVTNVGTSTPLLSRSRAGARGRS